MQPDYKNDPTKRHVDVLRPHPAQPRAPINPKASNILELRDSIIEKGILEPLLITPDNFILAGHRRRVSSRLAYDLTKDEQYLWVPIVTYHLKPDEDPATVMLHENMQRHSLTLTEEACAFYELMQRRNLTSADLARILSINAPSISGRLAILKLPVELQALYDSELLQLTAAPLLARVTSQSKQLKYANMLARKQMSVPQLQDLVTKEYGRNQSTIRSSAIKKQVQQNLKNKKARTKRRPNETPQAQLEPTRAEAIAALANSNGRKVTLFDVRVLTDSVCMACGMLDNPQLCRTCPLPRLLMAIVSRAT